MHLPIENVELYGITSEAILNEHHHLRAQDAMHLADSSKVDVGISIVISNEHCFEDLDDAYIVKEAQDYTFIGVNVIMEPSVVDDDVVPSNYAESLLDIGEDTKNVNLPADYITTDELVVFCGDEIINEENCINIYVYDFIKAAVSHFIEQEIDNRNIKIVVIQDYHTASVFLEA